MDSCKREAAPEHSSSEQFDSLANEVRYLEGLESVVLWLKNNFARPSKSTVKLGISMSLPTEKAMARKGERW